MFLKLLFYTIVGHYFFFHGLMDCSSLHNQSFPYVLITSVILIKETNLLCLDFGRKWTDLDAASATMRLGQIFHISFPLCHATSDTCFWTIILHSKFDNLFFFFFFRRRQFFLNLILWTTVIRYCVQKILKIFIEITIMENFIQIVVSRKI